MKITNIEVFRIPIPLKKPFKIQLAEVFTKDHVVAKVRTDVGITGLGEIAPLPQFAGEAGESMSVLIEKYLAPALIGKDPVMIGRIVEIMDEVIEGNPLAKSVLDFAVHDIVARAMNVSVGDLLGGRNREAIPLCWVMGIGDPEKIIQETRQKMEEGYRCFKLKAGLNPKEDIQRVRLLREAVGDDIQIRVDANQGYTVREAIGTIDKMEPYNPQYVEQPVSRWDIDGLAQVTHSVSVPVLADECIFSIRNVLEVVQKRAADIINIKVGKLGGLYRSRQALAIAQAAELPCMIGSMLESGIGTAAGAHFAAAVTGKLYECELIGPFFYTRDILKNNLVYREGTLAVPKGPGLGVDLDSFGNG
jgi:L-Ala-D/L-Glu epimerase